MNAQSEAKRVLVVGFGAVGQPYARHMQLGGARVHAWVRPYQREQAEAGVRLYPLSLLRRRPSPVTLHVDQVHTEVSTLCGREPDQIWLCVAATALRGAWLGELLRAAPKALVVCLTPGVRDRDLLSAHVDPSRVVQGMIPIISYQTPLPGEDRPAGVAYWFPPFMRHPFNGTPEAVAEASQLLARGGWRVTRDPNLAFTAGSGSALLMPLVAALELAGWSFRELGRADSTQLAMAAAREALVVIAAREGRKPAPLGALARRSILSMALRLSGLAAPMPLEVYFRYHFEKTGAQTRAMLDDYATLGAELGVPTDRVRELRSRLGDGPAVSMSA